MPGLLLDSNVWVAATFPTHEFHGPSVAILKASGPAQPVLWCRATELSYLRLVTSPRILERYGAEGMSNRHAVAALAAFRARPGAGFREVPPGTAELWQRLAGSDTASPKVWMDAYLAAFAIAGAMEFATLDRDFHVYEVHGLRLRLLVAPPMP